MFGKWNDIPTVRSSHLSPLNSHLSQGKDPKDPKDPKDHGDHKDHGDLMDHRDLFKS